MARTHQSGPRNFKRKLVIPSAKDYPMKIESKATQLPMAAQRMYGCMNCEWKNTPLCQFGYKSGKAIPLKTNCHVNGICVDRKNWLLSFSRSNKPVITFAEWQLDFNKALGQVQMHKDYQKLKELDAKMRTDSSKATRYERKLAREEWFTLWKTLTGFEDAQVAREMPKKIHIKREPLSLTDIQRIMRGDIIEADFKVKKTQED